MHKHRIYCSLLDYVNDSLSFSKTVLESNVFFENKKHILNVLHGFYSFIFSVYTLFETGVDITDAYMLKRISSYDIF